MITKTDKHIFVSDHAVQRYKEFFQPIDISEYNIRCIIIKSFRNGVPVGVQKGEGHLVLIRRPKKNLEAILACVERPDCVIIKTVLDPDHAKANMETFCNSVKAT
jgi:hypothetical protein